MLVDVRHRATAESAMMFWHRRGKEVSPITEYRYLVRADQGYRMAFKYQILVTGEIPKRDYMTFIHSVQDPPGWVYDEGGSNGQEGHQEDQGRGGERGAGA